MTDLARNSAYALARISEREERANAPFGTVMGCLADDDELTMRRRMNQTPSSSPRVPIGEIGGDEFIRVHHRVGAIDAITAS